MLFGPLLGHRQAIVVNGRPLVPGLPGSSQLGVEKRIPEVLLQVFPLQSVAGYLSAFLWVHLSPRAL